MSNERKDRGRKLLEKRLGSAIVHRADTVQTIESALRHAKPSPGAPDAEQLEMLGRYLQDYYRRWIDEPVPALGNKTTQDLDVVIDPPDEAALGALVTALLADEFYVDPDAAQETMQRRSMFRPSSIATTSNAGFGSSDSSPNGKRHVTSRRTKRPRIAARPFRYLVECRG